MDALISPSVQSFGIGSYLFEKAIDGLDREDLLTAVGPDCNPMIWILAHLTYTRCLLVNLLGAKLELPWEDRFGAGRKIEDPDEYPEAGEVVAIWKEVSEQLTTQLKQLSFEDLSKPSPYDFPVPDKSLRGAINFLAYHEAYHIGQLGYLRKWLGKGQLVG